MAPSTTTFCAVASWNWLNSTPALTLAPLAVSAPGLAAVTGRPSLVPSGSALTADC